MNMLSNISITLKLPFGFWKKLVLFGLAAFFIYFGIDHFINPDFYLSIMPPLFPLHEEAVYISGFFEIAGGIGVLIPRFRKIAGWGLFALLIAVYPANIYLAFNETPQIALGIAPFMASWVRLPLQFVFIGLAYWFTKS